MGDDLDFGLRARDLGLHPVRFPPTQWSSVIAQNDEMRLEALSPTDRASSTAQLTSDLIKPLKLMKDLVIDARRIAVRNEWPTRVNDGDVGRGEVRLDPDDHFQAIGPLPADAEMRSA